MFHKTLMAIGATAVILVASLTAITGEPVSEAKFQSLVLLWLVIAATRGA